MIWLVSVSTKSLVPLTCITQDFALGMIMTLSTKSLVLLTCITQDFALGMIMTRKGITPKTASAGSKGDSAQNLSAPKLYDLGYVNCCVSNI